MLRSGPLIAHSTGVEIQRHPSLIRWSIIGAAACVAILAAGWAVSLKLSDVARTRVLGLLEQHFGTRAELQQLHISLFPSVRIRGEGLVFREKGHPDSPPLITISRFVASASIRGALRKPIEIQQVRLEGLRIQVSRRGPPKPHRTRPPGGHVPDFVIQNVSADGTTLIIFPKDERKQPLEYDLRLLQLWRAGIESTMSFRATLTNAKPPGDIRTTGEFGPWSNDDIGQTPVSGTYEFRDADLSVFRGIAGKLASNGRFQGVLERIEVDGWANVPDFRVKVSDNPVALKTRFHAIVDGIDGNTLLEPVEAQFGDSQLTARGGVEGQNGVKGKTVSLDVLASGPVEDMLHLGVKGKQAPLNGAIRFQTKLEIPPGDVDIAQKLKLDGAFSIVSARFEKMDLQQKINELSQKGKGEPKVPPSETVASDFTGRFQLNQGKMSFRRFSFRIPGVFIMLDGDYGLLDETLDFHGTARLEAKLSQTTTGFKSFLLKIVDRFFKKKNAGAVIPIKITGTREKPEFGLDLNRKDDTSSGK